MKRFLVMPPLISVCFDWLIHVPLPQAAQARNFSIGIVAKHSGNFKISIVVLGGEGGGGVEGGNLSFL